MKIFILIILFGALASALFMFYRNEWVYRVRTEVINELPIAVGLVEHGKLSSYYAMFWQFWIWDVEKFKHPRDVLYQFVWGSWNDLRFHGRTILDPDTTDLALIYEWIGLHFGPFEVRKWKKNK